MKKNYIKMNENNILSLGNFCNVMKKVSINNIAVQSEVFNSIFGVNNVNNTTINNYCIGIRAIGIEYKKIFENRLSNGLIVDSIVSLVNILENKICNEEKITYINSSSLLKNVINELLTIIFLDDNITDKDRFKFNNNYDFMIDILKYIVLENKQPIYLNCEKVELNTIELNEFMKVKMLFGEHYYESLINLANKGNMYASSELASLYYDGIINGYSEYDKAYSYYMIAANKNHPKACWMIANMILNGKVKYDFSIMWKYLNKSIEFNSASGLNTLGLCYLKGINPNNEVNIEKAISYFLKSSEFGYVYAFNNLGKIFEESDSSKSLEYYMMSAELNNSWALNKVGEHYRKNGELDKALLYYEKAILSPIGERCAYAYYNLAKYYYFNDKDKYKEYMNLFNKLKKDLND